MTHLTAYDYDRQEWRDGKPAGELLLEQLKEELRTLEGPRGADYLTFTGASRTMSLRAAIATCKMRIADVEKEMAQ